MKAALHRKNKGELTFRDDIVLNKDWRRVRGEDGFQPCRKPGKYRIK